MQISLIIPCYNEAENIPLIIQKLYPLYQDKSFEIIFVENGSNDNSLSILNKHQNIWQNISKNVLLNLSDIIDSILT